jgi:hypothetical protein
MSRPSPQGSVEITLDGKEYLCCLAHAEIMELQLKCNAGPRRIACRLLPYDAKQNIFGDDYRYEDIFETLRLGLIGGGAPRGEAFILATKHSRPMEEARAIAFRILQPVIWGKQDEPLGKAEESVTTEATTGSQMNRSPSPLSSELPVQSA